MRGISTFFQNALISIPDFSTDHHELDNLFFLNYEDISNFKGGVDELIDSILFIHKHWKSKSNESFIFYVWHDEQAGQLRFSCTIKKEPPFNCRINKEHSLANIINSWIFSNYNYNIDMNNLKEYTTETENEEEYILSVFIVN